MRTLLWVFLLVGIVTVPFAGAADVVVQDSNLVIVSDKPLDIVQHFLKSFPRLKDEVERILGLHLQNRPVLLLVEDREKFERMSENPLIAAFAVPSRNLIVMRVGSADSRIFVLDDILKHELCHLILHENIQESGLPKWLDEGICQWVSGTIGDFLAQGQPELGRRDFPRSYIPLERLSNHFPTEKNALFLAYWQSRSFVQYLSGQHGREKIVDILHSLKSGTDVNAAFLVNIGQSVETAETKWLEEESNRNSFLLWITQYLYELLFFAAALLAVLAFILRTISNRKRYSISDREDTDF
ncbi:MAG: peptidase MA family metallohydrolase [Desulforhabdus sp.]|nr:peptidase MA family metallohydrolase [Desulforhabdus sp.]